MTVGSGCNRHLRLALGDLVRQRLHRLLHQRLHVERLKVEFTAAQTRQLQNGLDEVIHAGHGGLDEAQGFGDVLVKGPGDLSALGRLQVREQRWQGRLEHVAGGAQLAGKALQVHERRAQVVRDNVGKAPDLFIRRLQFGRTLLDAHLQLVAGVPQRLLRLHPGGEIVHNAGEHTAAVQVHLTHRQRHGERGAIPALPAHFTPNADDVLLARLEIPRQVAVVLLPVGRGHEHADVLPNDVGGGIPKEALGRRIERLDGAALVDGDDAVHRGVQNGLLHASLSRSAASACSWTTTRSSCCWCSSPPTCNA